MEIRTLFVPTIGSNRLIETHSIRTQQTNTCMYVPLSTIWSLQRSNQFVVLTSSKFLPTVRFSLSLTLPFAAYKQTHTHSLTHKLILSLSAFRKSFIFSSILFLFFDVQHIIIMYERKRHHQK